MPTATRAMSALADEAVRLGPPPAAESYLLVERVLEAARANRCRRDPSGLRLPLGELRPSPAPCAMPAWSSSGRRAEAMERLGGKDSAKALLEPAGVPLVPGYHGADQDDRHLLRPRPGGSASRC